MKKIFVSVAILVLLVVAGLGWWNSQIAPVSNDSATKVVVIPKGEGVSAVAERLYSQGLIKSPLAFKIYAKFNNLAVKIQAGSFKIAPSNSYAEIAGILTKGTDDVWVTFIEGWRVEEMATKLNAELGIQNSEFLKLAKEGYMFPDTYLFPKEATAEFVASTMSNTFEKRYNSDIQAKIKKQGLTSEEGVILASLVEREGRSDKVRTEVASILLKRFNMGMKLDVDATVQYAKDTQALKAGRLDKFWKPILRVDYTEVKSPYNTYLNAGLPPAPICNPGLSSLNAVADANPNTPYLYYFHDTKGNSYYAKTLEEHNQNVANHR